MPTERTGVFQQWLARAGRKKYLAGVTHVKTLVKPLRTTTNNNDVPALNVLATLSKFAAIHESTLS
jgi:hypothetical protein